jgi:ABC-type nickel/cobalt efflux system permease component RcnA
MMTTVQRTLGMGGMALLLVSSVSGLGDDRPFWMHVWDWALSVFAAIILIWFVMSWVRERRAAGEV